MTKKELVFHMSGRRGMTLAGSPKVVLVGGDLLGLMFQWEQRELSEPNGKWVLEMQQGICLDWSEGMIDGLSGKEVMWRQWEIEIKSQGNVASD